MTSSISGSMSSWGGMAAMRMQRPDPSQMASKLFSQLDTNNQGYIQKSDLQSAFDKISGSDGSSSGVDDIFQQLDGDSDGKVTKDEMSSGFKKLADELDSQFNSMRMGGFGGAGETSGMQGMQGMPPPPPPSGNDAGFTQDELSSQLDEIGSSDSTRSSLIGNIVNNFDKADADSDGKVSFQEAQAYDQANPSASSATSGSGGTGSATKSESSEAQMMRKIMELVHAYGDPSQNGAQSSLASLLSISA